MRNKTILHVISALTLLFFLLLAIGSTDDSTVEKDVSNKSAEFRISAQQLFREYDSNEVAADQKYKGKVLEVNGIVEDIAKDITDNIYVTLKGNEYFGSVQCFFSDDHVNAAANLRKGQRITVKGKCDGKMMNVIMRGCMII